MTIHAHIKFEVQIQIQLKRYKITNHKKDAFCRMFLKGMCRDMIKANCLKLDRYKFEFVIEEKNK